MFNGEKILHTAMIYIQTILNGAILNNPELKAINQINREALISYADVVKVQEKQPVNISSVCNTSELPSILLDNLVKQSKMTRWNVPNPNAKLARDCNDHPAVSPTSYMEVHSLIGTNGCSIHAPWWSWVVMGVIATNRGKLLVCPGDWVIECASDYFLVMTDEEYCNISKKCF